MLKELEALVDRYDAGRISRRDLLSVLAACVAPGSLAAPRPEIGVAKQLNHVTLFVRNVEQSRTFYQDLFGMPVLTRQVPGINLSTGAGFLGLYPSEQDEMPRIDHFCLGLEHFDAEAARRKLATRRVDATIRTRGDTKELYFADHDGIRVQLQDLRYRGGVGPIGDRNPKSDEQIG